MLPLESEEKLSPQNLRQNLLECLIMFLFRTDMICVVSGATMMHAHLTATSVSVKLIPTTDRFKDYSTGRNTTVCHLCTPVLDTNPSNRQVMNIQLVKTHPDLISQFNFMFNSYSTDRNRQGYLELLNTFQYTT